MSNEFGYIPESPEQSFGNNKGIFTPTDIYDLTRADKYTNYGQLELIETQTYSSDVTTIEFNSIQESTYNVHFMTFNNLSMATGTNQFAPVIQLAESGTYETSSVYQVAYQSGTATGTFSESRSTGQTYIVPCSNMYNQSNNTSQGYAYFYNLGDSAKYSFATSHQYNVNHNLTPVTVFGSGVLPQTSTVDGIRFIFTNATKLFGSYDISLYGIKEYS